MIAQQLKEHQFKQIKGIDPALLQQERQLKYQIARLNVGIDQTAGPAIESMVREKMNFEIELSKLQQAIEQERYLLQAEI